MPSIKRLGIPGGATTFSYLAVSHDRVYTIVYAESMVEALQIWGCHSAISGPGGAADEPRSIRQMSDNE